MVTTLKRAIQYFQLNEEHFNKRIEKAQNSKSDSLVEYLTSIRDKTCDNAEYIAFVLNHISYHKVLIKYDIVNADRLEVVIYYEDKSTASW